MPSAAEFDRAVARVEEAIERIGDQVAEPISDPDDPSRKVGFNVHRDTYTYQVIGRPETEFFSVVFPFSIVTQLAELISEEDAREVLADGNDGPGDDPARRAATALLNGMDEDDREEFTYHLVIVLSAEGAAYSLETTGTGAISGFQVFSKVFPYEREFSLTEFNRTAQAVVNTGISGLIFVNLAFDLPAMADIGTVSGVSPWYIH